VTLYYLCGSENVPYGGVRVAYRHVDILNDAGISASILHDIANFRCTWFENMTKVSWLPLEITDADVIVVPENRSSLLNTLAPGVPKVSFNQNAFYTFQSHFPPEHPYLTARDLVTSMTISEANRAFLEYAFPKNTFKRIHLSIDPTMFHCPEKPPGRRIAYMTRKRPLESRMVLDILRSRGALRGWETVVIDQLPESGVASALRSVSLFLSFGWQEGFSLAPLEALASGCSVIGYSGVGGREYFERLGAVEIPDGDVVLFAREVDDWIQKFDDDEHWRTAPSSSEKALEAYSQEQERSDLVSFWSDTLAQMPSRRGITHTVKRSDVSKGSLHVLFRRSVPYLQAGLQELLTVSRSRLSRRPPRF
jgi:hypothetical protein